MQTISSTATDEPNAGLKNLAQRLWAAERNKQWKIYLMHTSGVAGMAKHDIKIIAKNRVNFAKVVKLINMWKGWHRLKG